MTSSDLSWYLSLRLNYLPITRLDKQWMYKHTAPRCFRNPSVHLAWLTRLHSNFYKQSSHPGCWAVWHPPRSIWAVASRPSSTALAHSICSPNLNVQHHSLTVTSSQRNPDNQKLCKDQHTRNQGRNESAGTLGKLFLGGWQFCTSTFKAGMEGWKFQNTDFPVWTARKKLFHIKFIFSLCFFFLF